METEEASGRSAKRLAEPASKAESVLMILDELAGLSPARREVARRTRPRRADFLRNHYAANRPVVIMGMLEGCEAWERWSLDYLAEACGSAEVEFMDAREEDASYELNCDAHRKREKFGVFIAKVQAAGTSNDIYLVANNGTLDRPGFEALRREAPTLPEYLDPTTQAGKMFLWLGPSGCVTPLHHDLMNVLAVLVRGRKRFLLMPPQQLPWVYNHVGVFSAVDPRHPRQDLFPEFRNATPVEVELEEGEALFVPVGWWHYVETVEPSIMLSYTNFAFPNEFRWCHPGEDRDSARA